MNEKPKLQTYKEFKSLIDCEKYLACIPIKRHRIELTRLRLSNHDFGIELKMRNQADENCDTCKYCLNEIEDEHHVILICPLYITLRKNTSKNIFGRHPILLNSYS